MKSNFKYGLPGNLSSSSFHNRSEKANHRMWEKVLKGRTIKELMWSKDGSELTGLIFDNKDFVFINGRYIQVVLDKRFIPGKESFGNVRQDLLPSGELNRQNIRNVLQDLKFGLQEVLEEVIGKEIERLKDENPELFMDDEKMKEKEVRDEERRERISPKKALGGLRK